ncbi:tetratricopeptide repeat protein [Pseudomarimonas salicorniae]|uniref:Tetratricopeptide repeat protein n=1 Tax=Pseudomarimonas salicorniae TaxID=2933270 RepID=A0ABT0GKW9_9GAMM|nr:tetratricopeptide repeat protein [Lysobacter sp. CAU 1642]
MVFWILIAAMTAAALLFVLMPLVRDGGLRRRRRAERVLADAHAAGLLDEQEYRKKLGALDVGEPASAPPARGAAAGLALLLPLSAALLYFHLGEPRALDGEATRGAPTAASAQADTEGAPPPDMEQAVQGLAERLRNEPDNPEGWLLLGRAYKSMERFEPAKEALSQAWRLAPDNPDVMIEYAEAQALSAPRRRIEGEPLEMIRKAVELQPDHQRGIWLLGVAAMQGGRPKEAVDRWETLRQLISSDLSAVRALDEQIEGARQAAGLPPARQSTALADSPAGTDGAPEPAPAAAAEGDGPRLTVTVDIAPALRERLKASDVLFVFARPAEGSRMPLAIQRLPAANLPATVILDDSHSMMPALKLSTMPQVVVGARVSSSGQAIPQPGDLEGLSPALPNSTREPVRLTIDTVVE